jgi:hypothetical protein
MKEHGNNKPCFCSKDDLFNDYITKELSYLSISKKHNVSIRRVKKWINLFNIKPRPKHTMKNLTGKRFGRLVVKGFIPKNLRNSTTASWLCLCDCGVEKIIKASSLNRKLTTSCGCFKKEKSYKGVKDLSGSYINRVKKGAKSRGIEFNITGEYLWSLFIQQKGKCAFSGIPIVLERNLTKNYPKQTASLDRIDSDLGYVKGNVCWVHKIVNMMKGSLTLKDFLFFCDSIVRHKNI